MLPGNALIIPLSDIPDDIIHYAREQAHEKGVTLRDHVVELLKQDHARRQDAPFDPSKAVTLATPEDFAAHMREHPWPPRPLQPPQQLRTTVFEGEFGTLPTEA